MICVCMFEKEITFDRFIRGLLLAGGAVGALLLVHCLSSVLLPFFVAWLLAYMLYPTVCFLQYRCRLRSRILSIVVTLTLLLGALAGVLLLIIPPAIGELAKLSGTVAELAREYLGESSVSKAMEQFLQRHVNENSIVQLIQQDKVQSALQQALSQVWALAQGTFGVLMAVFGAFIIVLYLFFILMDYEKITEGWVLLVPQRHRGFLQQLVADVEVGMNAYFRGQSLIALLVGILFAIGFSIMGMPMAVGLGLFIGVLNLVPYLQVVGFVPTLLLAFMKANETGENFWVILLWALVVFAVVQSIQDFYLVPKIMGHVMGLKPAVILLSLSVWGSILGFIGLIVALPLTTLCLSYYRRFVLKEPPSEPKKGKEQ